MYCRVYVRACKRAWDCAVLAETSDKALKPPEDGPVRGASALRKRAQSEIQALHDIHCAD